MDLTIAICTYNGARRVPEVLRHLEDQNVAEDIEWEVMVVDNNSTDETASAVREYRKKWRHVVPLRYVPEERQGLSFARQRAVEEAKGDWVAFLDDDNLPEKDWVQHAVSFARSHDRAASFGGQLIGEYEVEPPTSFGILQGLFAINETDTTYCYSENPGGEMPPGAGMVVRRSAWLEHVPPVLRNTGVSAGSRANVGEDLEAQWYLRSAGWEIWHNADMICRHKIPASRLSESYLEGFIRGIGASRHSIRKLRYEAWQWPVMAILHWLNDARMLIEHLIRYRNKLQDPFVRGRARLLLHLLKTPFTARR